jgi:hypothetical protein
VWPLGFWPSDGHKVVEVWVATIPLEFSLHVVKNAALVPAVVAVPAVVEGVGEAVHTIVAVQ